MTGLNVQFGPRCSLPGCDAKPALQWTRQATEAERAAVAKSTSEQRILDTELRRHRQRGVINELRSLLEDPALSRDRLSIIQDQLAREQATLDAIADPPPLPDTGVVVAVFGCDTHKPDDDRSTHLHEAHCLTAGPCQCTIIPAPQ